MSLYSSEVKMMVHEAKAPYPGFIIDVVEFETYLTLRIYRSIFETYTRNQKEGLVVYLSELLERINLVVPCYLEVYGDAN